MNFRCIPVRLILWYDRVSGNWGVRSHRRRMEAKFARGLREDRKRRRELTLLLDAIERKLSEMGE